jgi:hypothetical protein
VRWFFAGLSFAALVAIAIVTAAVRADNVIRRHAIERRRIEVQDRGIELLRLDADLLDSEASQRLARAHWRYVESEFARRRGALE